MAFAEVLFLWEGEEDCQQGGDRGDAEGEEEVARGGGGGEVGGLKEREREI